MLLVLACSSAGSACYTYHAYQIGGANAHELGNQPGTEWQHRTLHSFAWGAIRQDIPVKCQLSNGTRIGIEEVKIDTNFGYGLASVASLGMWVPFKVSWRCAKPPVSTGTLR